MTTTVTGRPTSYNETVQARAEHYVMDGYAEVNEVIPSVAGLACYLGVARSTVYLWRDNHPRFSDTLSAIEVKQESITLNGSLRGDLNSTIAKLVLANHGYSDKIQQDLTTNGKDINPTVDVSKLSTAALAEILNAAETPSD